MTQTEKQYAKNLGKLFVLRERQYDMDKQGFLHHHHLCFVYGMKRTGYNNKTGAYAYCIQTLSNLTERHWREEYAVKCREFISPRYGRETYLPATPENVELVGKVLDESQISDNISV